MTATESHLSHEARYVTWLISNSIDALQGSILPALERLPAVHAARCIDVLASAATHLTHLAEREGKPPAFPDLAAEVADIDLIEARLGALTAPPEQRGEQPQLAVARDALEAFLRKHPHGGARVRLVDVERMPGGRSKTTLAVRLQGASDFPGDLVIRKDQESVLNGTSVVSEGALLGKLHQAGLKVPKPFHLETGDGALGAPFLVLERLRGTTAGDVFDPPRNESLALQLAQQVGKLHSIDVEVFADDEFLKHHEVFTDQLRERLDLFKSNTEQFSHDYPSVTRALEWLYAHVDGIGAEVRLVHGDIGFHNVLADGDELTAVLDWELASLGHPARDLGYLRSTIEMMTTWEQFLDVYHQAGGVRCDPDAVDFYMLFSSLWLYQHLARSTSIRMESDARNIEYASSGAVLMQNMRYRLARQLKDVLDRDGRP